MKKKTLYVCTACGHQHARWQGSCSACGQWNTLQEEVTEVFKKGEQKKVESLARGGSAVKLEDINFENQDRINTGISELDQVLGGGLVPGAMVLIGGEPGIGKSTLLLQLCKSLAQSKSRVLYASGEESESQVKLRAKRLGFENGEMYLVSETLLESIQKQVLDVKPDILILDSIQTIRTRDLDSTPGTVSQVRECTMKLLDFCKPRGLTCLLVGHVTKGGDLAGPRMLEHMVDVVLHFEGDRNHVFRLLRGHKNRYGATDEVGIFEMSNQGLKSVSNPSKFFLEDECLESGSCLSVILEGSQAFLVEVQALLSDNHYTHPKRTVMGYDLNRVQLLLAVMEKRMGLNLGQYDVYVNIAGGIKTSDPGLDLAVVTAILSSLKNQALSKGMLVFGEVGLGGEVRLVPRADYRVREAVKQGFTDIMLPSRARTLFQKESYSESLRFVDAIGSTRGLFTS